MRILGIDPGSRKTGYGVIDTFQNRSKHFESGFIKLPENTPLAERLVQLSVELSMLIERVQPDCGIVEEIFFAKNARSALVLGHARGVVLLELARSQVPIHEYAPKQIKQSLVGVGNAKKDQIQHMVRILLNLGSRRLQEDEADALALALAHAHILPLSQRLQNL